MTTRRLEAARARREQYEKENREALAMCVVAWILFMIGVAV